MSIDVEEKKELRLKVGDRVICRNGDEDLIVAEIDVKKISRYRFTISCEDTESEITGVDPSIYPLISKKGRSYCSNGIFDVRSPYHGKDIVKIIKGERIVKKYNWVFKSNPLRLNISEFLYSEEEARNKGNFLQKIESTMHEFKEYL